MLCPNENAHAEPRNHTVSSNKIGQGNEIGHLFLSQKMPEWQNAINTFFKFQDQKWLNFPKKNI